MELQHNRQITISVGKSRKDINWKPQILTVADLYDRLRVPARGTETLDAYMKLKKVQQDDLKDVGGFVAGTLKTGRRKAENVIGRDVITLDFDTIPAYGTDTVIQATKATGYSYCIYSTRKHTETTPRLRVLLPLDRTVTPDEYEAIARRMASVIGIQMADPTTFEPSRLMYWPSCCADSTYIYEYGDAPLAPADAILTTYKDWHNWDEWPQVPGAQVNYQKLALRQGDPEAKPGVVGAFNRVYDVYRAMDELLPHVYDMVDNDPNRFTYMEGSTTGGAVIYDNGKFLYSHHATDPCSGRLVNAFDLVRLHKFGDLDNDVSFGTPNNRLPSYTKMCEFAIADANVSALMAQERRDQAVKDFETVPAQGEPTQSDDVNWMTKLQVHPQTGAIKATIDNILIILDNDPLLKNKFALNKFAGRGEVLGVLPWDTNGHRRLWSDTDSNGLYWYLERVYNITGRGNIDAALDIHASLHAFNEVQDYIAGLAWDGTARLDTLFIDYLGAEDSDYNRAVCRKCFTAAVARAMEPGCKFDNMLILCGPQGIGKSTILDKMSRGWFNDSIRTFEGKDASELLQGVWLVEVAELDAFRRTDVARIKQFLSLRADRYRAAYGRNVKELPRCCVFFGTCNQMDFLQDTTGNRRFWPVDVGRIPATKNVWRDMDDKTIDQIWAEAKVRWIAGEATYLSGEIEKEAQIKQEQHREASVREGLILDFVSRQIPEDWSKWSIDRRRDFWAGAVRGQDGEPVNLVDRDRISAIEIWCELFNGTVKDIKNTDTREINAVLSAMKGWQRAENAFRCGPYNTQRGYVKKG